MQYTTDRTAAISIDKAVGQELSDFSCLYCVPLPFESGGNFHAYFLGKYQNAHRRILV